MHRNVSRLLIVLLALSAVVVSCTSPRLSEQDLGKLKVTSGTILVSDPSYLPDTTNAIEVPGLPTGEFPVIISVADNSGDQ